MDQGNEFTKSVNGESAVCVQESIMSYFHKPFWKHMLKKPPYKLHWLEFHGLPCFPLAVFIGKLYGIVFNAFNTVIGNGYTKDISGQVLE